MKKVILDTDIGCDIDDALCLTYLLEKKDCDLVGITVVSGQTQLRAELASAVCVQKNRNIPIYKGAEMPLMSGKKAEFPQQAEHLTDWPHQTTFSSLHAVDFMREMIYSYPGQITILAIGPLTNVALLFATYPECAKMLAGLYIMGGKFIGQPQLEWNFKYDPHAVQIVYNASVPNIVTAGLDVTLSFCMTKEKYRNRFAGRQPYLSQLADDWYQDFGTPIYFHDPLAMTMMFDSEICDLKRGTVSMLSATEKVVTPYACFTETEDGSHCICSQVDQEKFCRDFFGTLNIEDRNL